MISFNLNDLPNMATHVDQETCGFALHKGVLIQWDEDHDTRVIECIDAIHSANINNLRVIQEHEGSVSFIWENTIPEGYDDTCDIIIESGDVWCIAESIILYSERGDISEERDKLVEAVDATERAYGVGDDDSLRTLYNACAVGFDAWRAAHKVRVASLCLATSPQDGELEMREEDKAEAVIADEVMDALECKYIGGLTGMKVGDVVGVCSVPYELILVHDDYGYGRKTAPKEAPKGEGESL